VKKHLERKHPLRRHHHLFWFFLVRRLLGTREYTHKKGVAM